MDDLMAYKIINNMEVDQTTSNQYQNTSAMSYGKLKQSGSVYCQQRLIQNFLMFTRINGISEAFVGGSDRMNKISIHKIFRN